MIHNKRSRKSHKQMDWNFLNLLFMLKSNLNNNKFIVYIYQLYNLYKKTINHNSWHEENNNKKLVEIHYMIF